MITTWVVYCLINKYTLQLFEFIDDNQPKNCIGMQMSILL